MHKGVQHHDGHWVWVAGSCKDVSEWGFESLEKLQESSSDDEYFDAQPSHGGKNAQFLLQVISSLETHHTLCLWQQDFTFFFCQKSWTLHHWWHEGRTAYKECLLVSLL